MQNSISNGVGNYIQDWTQARKNRIAHESFRTGQKVGRYHKKLIKAGIDITKGTESDIWSLGYWQGYFTAIYKEDFYLDDLIASNKAHVDPIIVPKVFDLWYQEINVQSKGVIIYWFVLVMQNKYSGLNKYDEPLGKWLDEQENKELAWDICINTIMQGYCVAI